MFKCSYLLFYILLFSFQSINAQESEKTVSITVSGGGKTQDEAKNSALRSAIEQAFGAFISSKTEILNDQVVADQMASVSSGNIQSFTILNESQLPDGSWVNTIKAIVSVSKLTSFVESKGIAVEIKGGLFAVNIKQQLINEQDEIRVVNELFELLHKYLQISFNYFIRSEDPKSLDEESKIWEIPITVTATTNQNLDLCAKYCMNTLSALSLSPQEVLNYKKLNKDIFTILLNYKGITNKYYLRKKSSVNLINTLESQWLFYSSLFNVQAGNDILKSNIKEVLHKFQGVSAEEKSDLDCSINFLNAGQKGAVFYFKDIRTLNQIEKMSGYIVKPKGIVSHFENGGFEIQNDYGQNFVVSIFDLGPINWNSAKTACDELSFKGFNDWRIPTVEELKLIYFYLKKRGLGRIQNSRYWSSTSDPNFNDSKAIPDLSDDVSINNELNYIDIISDEPRKYYVRAVRSF